MSNFMCEICKTMILDSPRGYTTECEHYPLGGMMRCQTNRCEIQEDCAMWIHNDLSLGSKSVRSMAPCDGSIVRRTEECKNFQENGGEDAEKEDSNRP